MREESRRTATRRHRALLASFVSAASLQAVAADSASTLRQDSETRGYLVVRPDSCQQACPLLLALHGHRGSASGLLRHAGLRDNAQRHGYLVVAADGVRDSWNGGRGPYGSCCGEAVQRNIDDVAFLKDVVARVSAAYPVDRSRVYVTGWSNGCAMAQRLVAEAGEVFAAAACTGGYLLTMHGSIARPVSVTEIHAHDDDVVKFREQAESTGARENAARWAALDHCGTAPTHVRVGASSDVATFTGCAGGVTVRLVTLEHSGHDTYANGDGVDLAELVWSSVRGARLASPAP